MFYLDLVVDRQLSVTIVAHCQMHPPNALLKLYRTSRELPGSYICAFYSEPSLQSADWFDQLHTVWFLPIPAWSGRIRLEQRGQVWLWRLSEGSTHWTATLHCMQVDKYHKQVIGMVSSVGGKSSWQIKCYSCQQPIKQF